MEKCRGWPKEPVYSALGHHNDKVDIWDIVMREDKNRLISIQASFEKRRGIQIRKQKIYVAYLPNTDRGK